jgi:lipopolysaccharide biosynthesis regulator YciM
MNYRSELYALLALTAIKENHLQEAKGLLDRALEYDPHSFRAHYRMGRVLLQARRPRPQKAITHFDAALAQRENHHALAERCRAHLLLDQVEAAEMDCDAALAIDPNNQVALLHQGDIHFQKGDFTSARRSWKHMRAQGGAGRKLAKSRLADLPPEKEQEPTP